MQIDILTLFPKMFEGPFDESIVKRAVDKGLVEINLHDMRKWAVDKRGSVDDRPYGGGAGMVIRVDVIAKALAEIFNSKFLIFNQFLKSKFLKQKKQRVILLTPQGKVFDQEKARELAKLDRVVLICGHYEGFDERIREHLVDEQLSIGEYVLTGGELPAMVVCDSVVRLLPGVLKKEEATMFESFGEYGEYGGFGGFGVQGPENIKNQKSPKYTSLALSRINAGAPARSVTSGQAKIKNKNQKSKIRNEEQGIKDENNSQPVTRNSKTKFLEYPQYTRPPEFNGWKVPEILMSGDHKKIEEWQMARLKVKSTTGTKGTTGITGI